MVLPVISQEARQHQPALSIEIGPPPISPLIMLDKRKMYIPKLNQPKSNHVIPMDDMSKPH